jgi:hypothetical protein
VIELSKWPASDVVERARLQINIDRSAWVQKTANQTLSPFPHHGYSSPGDILALLPTGLKEDTNLGELIVVVAHILPVIVETVFCNDCLPK